MLASAPCKVKDDGAGLVGFLTRYGLWEAVDFSCGEGRLGFVTSSLRPVLWDEW